MSRISSSRGDSLSDENIKEATFRDNMCTLSRAFVCLLVGSDSFLIGWTKKPPRWKTVHISNCKSTIFIRKDTGTKCLPMKSGCWNTTVDERNPAPPDKYETLQIVGYFTDQLVQDFFHQQ